MPGLRECRARSERSRRLAAYGFLCHRTGRSRAPTPGALVESAIIWPPPGVRSFPVDLARSTPRGSARHESGADHSRSGSAGMDLAWTAPGAAVHGTNLTRGHSWDAGTRLSPSGRHLLPSLHCLHHPLQPHRRLSLPTLASPTLASPPSCLAYFLPRLLPASPTPASPTPASLPHPPFGPDCYPLCCTKRRGTVRPRPNRPRPSLRQGRDLPTGPRSSDLASHGKVHRGPCTVPFARFFPASRLRLAPPP